MADSSSIPGLGIFGRFWGGSGFLKQISNGPTLDGAPRTNPGSAQKRGRELTPENEDVSPEKKRTRRFSPPRMSSVPLSTALRRSGSVKALNLHDGNARSRPRDQMSSLRSEASFASGRSALSRGTSTGLSFHMDRVKLQTTSPTPGPDYSSLSAPKAGVSNQSYNVARPLGSGDMILDSAVSAYDANGRLSAQRGLTPTGATFGAMRTMLDAPMSNDARTPSKSPTSISSRPSFDRQASNGAWPNQPEKLNVRTRRFGDSSLPENRAASLSRNRTTSLLSMAASAYTPSTTSGNGEDRTTPTPTDGLSSPGVSSSGVASPSGSNYGSPPPAAAQQAPRKALSLQAQRALEGLSAETPLHQSRSFANRAPMKVKVPMPSKRALTASFGKSSEGGSRHSHSQSESGEGTKSPVSKSEASRGHERAASGPYANGRDQTTGKRILDKRRAEERDILDKQRSPNGDADSSLMDDVDLHVEPIQKENASQADTIMGSGSDAKPSKLVPPRNLANRLTPSIESNSNSGTSSRTVGRSQLRVGREKTNHQHSASVASASVSAASQAPPPSVSTGRASSVAAPESRTRIPSSEIPSRFNPTTNERLNRIKSTGRFSLPPDDDDEDASMTSVRPSGEKETSTQRAQTTAPIVIIPDNSKMDGGDREKTPEQDSSGATPMNISPIKEAYKRSGSSGSDMMSTTPTESSIRGAFGMTPIEPAPTLPPNPFAKVEAAPAVPTSTAQPPAPPVSFGFTPVAPAPAAESKLPAPSPFSFGSASAPAPKPTEEVKVTLAPAPSGFSFPPAPGTTTKPASSESISGFSFPSLSTTSFPAPAAQPAKKEAPTASPFSFGASPLPTIPTLSISPPTNTPVEAPKVAPQPFSFGSITPSAPKISPPAAGTKAPVAIPFSFGRPSAPATPAPSTPAPVSTTPATPSPVKPLFPFPGSTPTVNISTTPQSSPFSFGSVGSESPSPTKPPSLGAALEMKTPTRENMFSFGTGPAAASTTPAATPAPATGFSFGNAKSTTPAVTPSPAPFSFGAPAASSTSSAAPFTFGAAPPAASTTPAVTPIQTGGFNFSAPIGGINNPFASQTTPTATRGFNFGDSTPAPSTTPSFSFGTPGDATPRGRHTSSDSFSFGQAAPASNGFSFGAPANGSANPAATPGLVFPSGPTTPLTKTLELDSMDASPIRGGVPAATNGSSFSAASSGPGFSFGSSSTSGSGFGAANPAPPPAPSTNSGFGAPSASLFGSGFGKEPSPAPSPSPSSFSFGNNAGASGGFGQAPSSAPFGQSASSGFGHNSGFSFSAPNSATSASPFNQAAALPSPALGGFAQLSSPAASPFSTPVGLGAANPFGAPQGQGRPSEEHGSDGGSQAGGDGTRKIAPMPKPRRNRTQQETRSALAKFHRG